MVSNLTMIKFLENSQLFTSVFLHFENDLLKDVVYLFFFIFPLYDFLIQQSGNYAVYDTVPTIRGQA